MEKVRMTQEQFSAVRSIRKSRSFNSLAYLVEREFDPDSANSCVNEMSDDQIAAAWLGEHVCEIGSKYHSLTGLQALHYHYHGEGVLEYRDRRNPTVKWHQADGKTPFEVFQKKGNEFRWYKL